LAHIIEKVEGIHGRTDRFTQLSRHQFKERWEKCRKRIAAPVEEEVVEQVAQFVGRVFADFELASLEFCPVHIPEVTDLTAEDLIHDPEANCFPSLLVLL
jgi:hypothetical protein